jgi:hypothetical protein
VRGYVIALFGGVLTVSCSVLTNFDALQCVGGACDDAGPSGEASVDAPTDAGSFDADAGDASGRCDKAKPFAAPQLVTELDQSAATEFGARLTADELTVFFTVADFSGIRIFSATRATTSVPFGTATFASTLSATGSNSYPSITEDGLAMFLESDRVADAGFDLFEAVRASKVGPFGAPAQIPSLDTPTFDGEPYVAPDGKTLYFVHGATSAGPFNIYASAWTGAQFGAPVVMGVVEANTSQSAPVITADGLTLYYASDRAGGSGGIDVWKATRKVVGGPSFNAPVHVPELDTASTDAPTWISADECVIYLQTTRNAAELKIYRAVRPK